MNAIERLRESVIAEVGPQQKGHAAKGCRAGVCAPHDALAAVDALYQAAKQTVAGVERDLPEWLADDGDYTVDGFDYFIALAAAVRRVEGGSVS